MTSRSQVSPDNLCSVNVTVIILCAPFFIFYIRAPTNFDSKKQQHTGLLVGQDIYENDDCDADGDSESGKDINCTGGNTTPTECRSNEEVCHVLPHGEPTNASQMSTSVPPSLSWHPLSHPSLPAPTLPPIAPSTHSPPHRSQHPLSHPSLPAPTATYHPTATLPVSDQRLSSLTSPHTSTPNQNPTAHPTKRARREQRLSAPHRPPIQPRRRSRLPRPLRRLHQPRAQRRPLCAVPVPPEQPEHLPPHKHCPGTQPIPHHRRPVPPLYHAHPLAHQARGPHAIFSAPHNPFGSLIAVSASSAATAGTFDLEWHNQQRGMPQQAQVQAFASPSLVPPQQKQNGMHQPPGGKLGGPGVGGGEEARDTTMWLEYLTGIPSSAPAPLPANAVLRSDGRSLMHGGGEIDIDQGETVSERESADGLGRRWASWMMPLLGPRVEEEAEYPGGALSGAFGRQQLKELYSCYSVVTSLSSLRLYCREGEER